jgi:hypothetical protein
VDDQGRFQGLAKLFASHDNAGSGTSDGEGGARVRIINWRGRFANRLYKP